MPRQNAATDKVPAASAHLVKPKVLLVTPVFPDITGYGLAMRAGVLLEALAAHASVFLLVIPIQEADKLSLPKPMQPFCTRCRVVTISKFDRALVRLKQMVEEIGSGASRPPESLFVSSRLLRTVREAFGSIDFDYLYIFRLYMALFSFSYFAMVSLKGRYLDLDDIESLTRARLATRYRANGMLRQARKEERVAKVYAVYEREWLAKFDGISVCSEEDKKEVSQFMPQRKIRVLPNVVRLPVVSAVAPTTRTFKMLFVGNLNYYPNQDGLTFLIEDILPELRSRAKCPFRLIIIGSGKWRKQRTYSHRDDCRFIGFVRHLAPHYEQTDAVVVPLRVGGGTRIKVLEAFSFKRPVVSTSFGVEGIEVEHERHVLVADRAEHFAEQCCRIMEDRRLTKNLVNNAFECVKARYTIDVFRSGLSKMVK